MDISVQKLAAGFIAGAIGILLGHQLVILLLTGSAYSFAGVAPFGVPRVINAMFWGGLWGALMAAIWEKMPPWPDWAKGAVFAVIFPLIVGSWIVVALIKGNAMFAGFNLTNMLRGVAIYAVWGVVMGLVYPRLAAQLGQRVATR